MKSLFRFLFLAFFLLTASHVVDAKEKDDVVRILSIGNSFSVDAIENHFHELASAAGRKVIVGNMYIGGCSLEKHLRNAKENISAYTYSKRGLDGKERGIKKAFEIFLKFHSSPATNCDSPRGRSPLFF